MENDLPLLANVNLFKVSHYRLKFICDFKTRVFSCQAILSVQCIANSPVLNEPIKLILDAKDIHVDKVEALNPNAEEENLRSNSQKCFFELHGPALNFEVEPWSINIWKEGVETIEEFPRLIKISYVTDRDGSSVTWTKDQTFRDCVFTQGAWINNRSLFPCQEPPIAMATWQAWVIVPGDCMVVMSGDNQAIVNSVDGMSCFYLHTSMELPMSTLALAAGYWEQSVLCQQPWEIRAYAPSCMMSSLLQVIDPYAIECLQAATSLLGSYPFNKLDILVLPRCLAALGLASPNVIFISQSLISKDGSMKIRIAHEIVHSWFGLLIGALDWTEEWLSEGFATFLEDHVHAAASKDNRQHMSDLSELRAYLRFRNLSNELLNTEDELQVLRPSASESLENSSACFVKNGMNVDKCFTQVHYLKGYFLLRYLYDAVGHGEFFRFLRKYVAEFSGKLVLSKEVMAFFFKTMESTEKIQQQWDVLNNVCKRWLDEPGMPNELKDFETNQSNILHQDVKSEVESSVTFIYAFYANCLKFKQMCSDQIVLLLEYILDFESISPYVLSELNSRYSLDTSCADVLHRWCELIIKHKLHSKYSIVNRFLKEHQAMGVYLYGEAIISDDTMLQNLALDIYKELQNEMDESVKTVVAEMLGIANQTSEIGLT